MAEHILILFEPFDTPPPVPPGEATLIATAPMATAMFTDMVFESMLLATAPMASALFESVPAVAAPTPPPVSALYATAPMAEAYFSDAGAGKLIATAPMATAMMFDTAQDGILIATAPMAEAYFTDELPTGDAFLNIAWHGELYCSAWAGFQHVELSDTMALSGAVPAPPMMIRIRSALGLGGSLMWHGEYAAHAVDTLELGDRIASTIYESIADELELGETLTPTYTAMARVVDGLLLSGVARTLEEAKAIITDALAFYESTSTRYLESLGDTIEFSEALRTRVQALARLVDGLVFSDEAPSTVTFSAVVRDTMELSSTTPTFAEYHAHLTDELEFVARLNIDNFQYIAWTMNAATRAATTYTNYPFNSFMRLGNRYYGMADDGLYRLDGESDDGEEIKARVRMGMSALGIRQAKRMESMYLGYASSGDLLLRVITASEVDGAREANLYRLKAQAAGSVREGRVKIGRGLKSIHWDYEIENVSGADFDLENIEFLPLVLERKIRGNAGGN